VPHKDRIANARRVGVVFGQRTQLWWDLPVRDSLELLRDMHGLSDAQYRRNLERLDATLGLDELLPVTARKLSLGQRMRADLAAALVHTPPIVFLDEPTIGLDIAVKDRVRAFVRELVAEGTTVMLTTHDLGDIEDICRRLVIIDQGRIVYDGDIRTVVETYARERTMHFSVAEPPTSLAGIAGRLPDAAVAEGETAVQLDVTFDPAVVSSARVLAAVQAEADVVDLRIDEPAIEDVVRRVYAGELGAGQ
jgi:ABC-2 type transport system ATP-binding protein